MHKKTLYSALVTLAIVLSLFPCGGIAWADASLAFQWKVMADGLLKVGKTAEAVSLYERVLKEDPTFANAYYNLATAYYLEGKIGKAAEQLEAFVRLRPDDAEAWYNLGGLKLRLGHFDEAWKCFLRAENCPCTRLIRRKTKEALHFMKDLRNQDSETQQLVAYFLTSFQRP